MDSYLTDKSSAMETLILAGEISIASVNHFGAVFPASKRKSFLLKIQIRDAERLLRGYGRQVGLWGCNATCRTVGLARRWT